MNAVLEGVMKLSKIHNFRKGQLVRCITGNIHNLTKGKIYQINSTSNELVCVVGENHADHWEFAGYFESCPTLSETIDQLKGEPK